MRVWKIEIATLRKFTDKNQANKILINVYVCACVSRVRVCVNLCHVCTGLKPPEDQSLL